MILKKSKTEKVEVYVNEEKGELFLDKSSSMLPARGVMAAIQRETEKVIGPATKTIVKTASKESALSTIVNSYPSLIKYPGTIPKKIVMEKLTSIISKRGWGIPELIDFDRGKCFAKVKLYNSSIANFEISEKPVCYIFCGVIEAFFEVVFKKKVLCTETKCVAMGNPHCEFEIHKSGIGNNKKMRYSRYKQKKASLKNHKKLYLKLDERGELFYQGSGAELYLRTFWPTLQREFEKIIGPAVKTISYNVVKEGTIEAGYSKKVLLKIMPIKIYENILIKECRERGYGVLEIIKRDTKNRKYIMRVKNSFNALTYGKVKRPVCYAIAGLTAGVNTLFFGRDMECKETKCVAMGDPYCEFKVYPNHTKCKK